MPVGDVNVEGDLIVSEEILDYYRIDGLYHITHLEHIRTIIRDGLLSHNSAHQRDVVQHNISNTEVQELRAQRLIGERPLHDYVPLYFNPRNAMLYRILKELTPKNFVVVIRISRKLMLRKEVWFTDGNAAIRKTRPYNNLEDLDKLDWECIRATHWKDYDEGVRKCMAEILVPDKISANFIKRRSNFFVQDQEAKTRIVRAIPSAKVTIDKYMFFS